MLPRRSRLPREGFTAASRGKRVVAPHFSISALKTTPGEGRAAAVVSKKVAAKSVDRHLLKRRILAIAAAHVGKQLSFIVYARAGAARLPFTAVKSELEPLFATLGA